MDKSITLAEDNSIHPPVVVELPCGICGKKVGEYTLPSDVPGNFDTSTVTPKDLGFADVRCDTCEITSGSFSLMAEEFRKKTGGTSEDYLAQVELNGGDVKRVIETLDEGISRGVNVRLDDNASVEE